MCFLFHYKPRFLLELFDQIQLQKLQKRQFDRLPIVQSLNVANVCNYKLFIKLLKAAVINSNNIKETTTSRGFGNFIIQKK